jgi:hypothetical protein
MAPSVHEGRNYGAWPDVSRWHGSGVDAIGIALVAGESGRGLPGFGLVVVPTVVGFKVFVAF